MPQNWDDVRAIQERVREMRKDYHDDLYKAMEGGKPIGYHELNTPEFVRWFEQKAAENPNWAPSLAYTKQGRDIVAKYERATGLRGT